MHEVALQQPGATSCISLLPKYLPLLAATLAKTFQLLMSIFKNLREIKKEETGRYLVERCSCLAFYNRATSALP